MAWVYEEQIAFLFNYSSEDTIILLFSTKEKRSINLSTYFNVLSPF